VTSENVELQRQLDVVSDEYERVDLGGLIGPVGDGAYGLGPAASKVYGRESGLSIGGYGELHYTNPAGEPDEIDFTRAVLYFGYKFDEHWVFNSEIELEHTDEIFLEFATLDYLAREEINARAGLVLIPMGFLNELHEPTTYLASDRPLTETRIIPSTWRENGVGVFGDLGSVSYRAYFVNGFDAMGFTAEGLRGGRQKGGDALAEDFAGVARADWTGTAGVLAGGSVYYGNAGQEQDGLGDTTTSIYELHAEYKGDGLWARALYAQAWVDDVEDLNAALGFTGSDSVGEDMHGHYVEVGYDVMSVLDPGSRMSVSPFARYESIDTQADVPSGFASDSDNAFDVLTVGVAFQPIPSLVVKLDYGDAHGGGEDAFNATLGYVF
jgi:hypothetical protein